MTLSMTQWSMISKTKKRLSENKWHIPCVLIGFIGLSQISSYGIRSVSISRNYGFLRSKIPVMATQIGNEDLNGLKTPRRMINHETPMIVLLDDALYLGDIKSFTSDLSMINNKYRIPHVDGSPQLTLLGDAIKKWLKVKKIRIPESQARVAILLPQDQWPVAVVMQILSYIQTKTPLGDVVLASELN